jgi:protein ATS1
MQIQLYVFGSNGEGQLGIPAQDIISTPIIAKSWPSKEAVRNICSGDNHTLFLTDAAAVWGAGDNRKGQLGPSISTRTEFKKLQDGVSFCAATCESSAYIINSELQNSTARNTLTIEGTSRWGEVGIGPTTTDRTTLNGHTIQQQLSCQVSDLAAGAWHYVAILNDGRVFGWGKSRLGQLGLGLSSKQRVITPTQIEEDKAIMPIKVVCGKDFTYLVGHPSCGHHTLLGQDKFGLRSSMPSHIKNWKDIGATWHAIFVLFQDGTLTAWGKDNMWNLVPEGLPKIEKIAVGSEHILALTEDEKLISWGWGKHGNCGDLTMLEKEGKVNNDMVSSCWNEIPIPGKIQTIGAGFCTSFVLTSIEEDETR